jgi:hypothetical protein
MYADPSGEAPMTWNENSSPRATNTSTTLVDKVTSIINKVKADKSKPLGKKIGTVAEVAAQYASDIIRSAEQATTSGNQAVMEAAGRSIMNYRAGLSREDQAVVDAALRELGKTLDDPLTAADFIAICQRVAEASFTLLHNQNIADMLETPDKYSYQNDGHTEPNKTTGLGGLICCAYCMYLERGEVGYKGASLQYNSGMAEKGEIKNLGGITSLQPGMYIFQYSGKTDINEYDEVLPIMDHVGKVGLHDFGNGPELAVFHSVTVTLMEGGGMQAYFYDDTGPNITSINDKWTHYGWPNDKPPKK